MFRLVLCFLCFVALSNESFGQTVFTPSPIDFKQDQRLDALEKEVARVDILESEVFDLKEGQTKILNKLEEIAEQSKVVKTIEAKPVTTVSTSSVNNGLYSTDELRAIYNNEWPNGYRVRAATVSPKSNVWNHLVSDIHGFQLSQVKTLTQDEALGIHDLHHAGLIRSQKGSYSSKTVATSKPSRNYNTYSQPANSGCPNGQCARQRTNTISKSTGWYFGKNLGR
jgi:hypothetical protein